MPARAARLLLAGGLLANAGLVRHPLPLAVVQVGLALGVLAGRGGPAVLAAAALALVPLPVAEVRRWLGHVPLACDCQRRSGGRGWWPVVGAVADVALIGLAAWLARRPARRPTPA